MGLSVFFTMTGALAGQVWGIVLNYKQLTRMAPYLLKVIAYAVK